MPKEKEIIYIKQHFMKCFQTIANDRHYYTAWSEVIEMFALTIINPLTKTLYENDEKLKEIWQNRENRYLKIINGYKKGYTLGHNGVIFEYTPPKQKIPESNYLTFVEKYKKQGFSEFESQLFALKDLSPLYEFEFREVI